MSELAAHKADVTIPVYGTIAGADVYLKSEADKVIAELKEKLDLYKRGWAENDKVNAYLYAENRHHKYKRCLAMALYCHESAMWLEENGVNKSAVFMLRWEKRWLELAQKFKEAK